MLNVVLDHSSFQKYLLQLDLSTKHEDNKHSTIGHATYAKICDVPGEYHSSAMLVLPKHSAVHRMPLPVVAHQRNKSCVVLRNGRRHLQQ